MAAVGPGTIIAHRGLSDQAQVKYNLPEHSLPAYRLAIDHWQIPVIDLDAQFTRDGQLVIMHDLKINRTTNRTGYVKDRTLAYITAAFLELPIDRDGNDDNTPYHPPSLAQGLDFIQPKTVDGKSVLVTLETKGTWSPARMNHLYGMIKARGMLDRVIVHSFSETHVDYAKAAGFPLRGVMADTVPVPSPETVKQRGSYVFLKLELATPEIVSNYTAAGLQVAIWTVDNRTEYQAAADLGEVWAWIANDGDDAEDYLHELS